MGLLLVGAFSETELSDFYLNHYLVMILCSQEERFGCAFLP